MHRAPACPAIRHQKTNGDTTMSAIADADRIPTPSLGAKTFVAVAGPALIALVPMAVIPALPQMAAHFAEGRDGAFFAQMVMTAPAVMIIAATLAAGWLVDLMGRRRLLLASLVVYAFGGLGCILAPDANTLIAARLLLGFASGLVMTCSMSMVADHGEGPQRDRVLGFASASAAGLAVVAQVVGGQLVQSLGWRGSFGLYALAIPVFLVALSGATDVPLRATVLTSHSQASLLPRLWSVLVLTMVLTIGLFMPGIQGPFLLVEEGVTDPATIGMILASYSITAAVVAACYGRIAATLRMRGQISLACLGMGVGCIGLALLHGGVPTLTLGCVIIGAGVGLIEPLTVTLALQHSPAPLHTRAVGLLLSAVFLGQFLNPIAVSPLRTGLGVHGTFVAVGAFFLLLAGIATVGVLSRLTDVRPQR
jgi:MFS family permease